MASVQHQPAEVNVGQTHGPAAVWLYQQGVLFQFRLNAVIYTSFLTLSHPGSLC